MPISARRPCHCEEGEARRGNPSPPVGVGVPDAAQQVPLGYGPSPCLPLERFALLLPHAPNYLPLEGFAVLNDRPVACQTREPLSARPVEPNAPTVATGSGSGAVAESCGGTVLWTGKNRISPAVARQRLPTRNIPPRAKEVQKRSFAGVLSPISFAVERNGAVGDIVPLKTVSSPPPSRVCGCPPAPAR